MISVVLGTAIAYVAAGRRQYPDVMETVGGVLLCRTGVIGLRAAINRRPTLASHFVKR